MIQVLPLKFFVFLAVVATLTVVTLLDAAFGSDSLPNAIRISIVLVDLLIAVFAIKPVWRFFWRKFSFLEKIVFPDINGTYEVELQHNWPIQKLMMEAAADQSKKFDVNSDELLGIKLQNSAMKAKIDLGFFSASVMLEAVDPSAKESVIDRSRTISCSLVRPCDGYGPRLVYVYHQHNRRDKMAQSDDSSFFGAAVLHIKKMNQKVAMSGEYWTNRSWQKAVNTSGLIQFSRISDRS